ncbi:MAG: galactokinase [Pseudomonadota bacterium]
MSIADIFQNVFNTPAAATASVPGRVNLIGEHTDYNGGAVLPAGLQCRIQVALAPSAESIIQIHSTRFDGTIARPVGDAKRDDWTDYAMGALAKASELGWLTGGAHIAIDSDVPDGAGVSSSAALITAILRAANPGARSEQMAVEIAKHARAVENDYIGMPCGIMDQMAVGLADHDKALALNTSSLKYEVVDIPDNWTFAVIHSGVRRELADGRYKARFEECQQAADALQTNELCLLDAAQMSKVSQLPDNLRKRTQHVTSEHQRTLEATAAMKAQDLPTFARLMIESHRSYAQDFEASTPVIDALVEDAVAQGAKGARLTGGGFGGCIVALYDAADADKKIQALLDRHPNAWRV